MEDASALEREGRSAEVTRLLLESKRLHQSTLTDKASREMPGCHAIRSSAEQLVSKHSRSDTLSFTAGLV